MNVTLFEPTRRLTFASNQTYAVYHSKRIDSSGDALVLISGHIYEDTPVVSARTQGWRGNGTGSHFNQITFNQIVQSLNLNQQRVSHTIESIDCDLLSGNSKQLSGTTDCHVI